MYKLVKPLFFLMDPETAHHQVTGGLRASAKVWGVPALLKKSFGLEDPRLERNVFGLHFKNPVGMAAGFDKNAEYVDELADLGFGFIEIGTVTPRPQPGNPKPRMFRLVDDEGVINRMGFNNLGADVAATHLKFVKKRGQVIIGGNIGKNKTTPNEKAVDDYLSCYDSLYEVVDYFVVNVSSPNTPGLRDLQEKGPLTEILLALKEKNDQVATPRPILLKIAPDLTNEQLDDIIDLVQTTKIDGIIATNTTISREGLRSDRDLVKEAGGLSGRPLTKRATEVIRYLHQHSGGAFPIIGVGGIHSAEDALEKLAAGASLIQLYTGFVYEGPVLIKRICKALLKQQRIKA